MRAGARWNISAGHWRDHLGDRTDNVGVTAWWSMATTSERAMWQTFGVAHEAGPSRQGRE